MINLIQDDCPEGIKDSIKEKYDVITYEQPEIEIPDLTSLSGIILIVGTSGSGKSTILNSIENKVVNLRNKKELLDEFSSPQKGEELLLATGLRSIPTWFRPIKTLSNGERYRAEIALSLDQSLCTIDEFTSVVDRDTAKALSVSLKRWFDSSNIDKLFLASCHYDIVDWLQPDYIYDTDKKSLINRRSLRGRPSIQLTIRSSNYKDWDIFKKHHYLDTTMSKSVHCYTAYIGDKPVAFYGVIHGCGRDIRSFWRGSRLVVLPEFQGMGIGSKFSDTVASFYVSKGLRFFVKTAHPSLGEHMEKSPSWRPTSTNKKARPSYLKNGEPRESKGYGKTKEAQVRDSKRVCYSHEFIGEE